LTLETLALLQIANLPLPDSVFAHADFSGVHALLKIPAQKDVSRLAYAERAAGRGIIGISELADAYRATAFSAAALASPLSSSETGARLRALLFRASEEQKDPAASAALAVKFVQTSSPAFLNGAGALVAKMLGDIEPNAAMAKDAATLARIYMLADRTDLAQEWFDFAQGTPTCAAEMQVLWPQFVLSGFEDESVYAGNFETWLDVSMKNADPQTMRGVVVPTVLLLDAAQVKIPDSAWQKVLASPQSEQKIAFSPLLLERIRAAASDNRRAETVMLALDLAGIGDISLTAALGITSALHQAGFDSEADIFARQAIATLVKEK
jgi:hypothetical protein